MSITAGCPSDRLLLLEPDRRVAGIDWAKDDHAVVVVDAAGRTVERFTVAHTRAGLRELLRRLARLQVAQVAIERPDGQVVEALQEAGAAVVVISPLTTPAATEAPSATVAPRHRPRPSYPLRPCRPCDMPARQQASEQRANMPDSPGEHCPCRRHSS